MQVRLFPTNITWEKGEFQISAAPYALFDGIDVHTQSLRTWRFMHGVSMPCLGRLRQAFL